MRPTLNRELHQASPAGRPIHLAPMQALFGFAPPGGAAFALNGTSYRFEESMPAVLEPRISRQDFNSCLQRINDAGDGARRQLRSRRYVPFLLPVVMIGAVISTPSAWLGAPRPSALVTCCAAPRSDYHQQRGHERVSVRAGRVHCSQRRCGRP